MGILIKGRQNEHGQIRRHLLDARSGLDAVQARHVNIHNHKIQLPCLHRADNLGCVIGRQDNLQVRSRHEIVCQRRTHHQIVINQSKS